MNLLRKLASRNFFIFNLVLIGIIFGFSLAFLSFSCRVPPARNIAFTQQRSSVVIPQDALGASEALQGVLNAIVDNVLPAVVEVKVFSGSPRRQQGIGSGIIVRQDRNIFYVLTNNHVIGNAPEIVIGTKDGAEYRAEIVGRDGRRDLAIVSFNSNESFPHVVLGDSDNVRVGDWAIAMGNPLGEQFAFSVTMGIVSAVGRVGGPGGNINDFIQTDASINQGNSGGPLVNIRGEVIGINTWIASPTGGGNVGLGFAIPINNAKRAIDEFITDGALSEGWLGVTLTDPDRAKAAALGITGMQGSLLVYLSLGSPAHRSGIRVGDFFTHVDGREIRGTNHFIQMVSDLRPGQRAVFRVFRNGVSIDIPATVLDRRTQTATDNRNLWPGFSAHPLTSQIRSAWRFDSEAEGFFVSNVIAGSPGGIAGLQRGDLITAINGIPVNDMSAFYRVLADQTENELWFTINRGGRTLDTDRFRRD